MIPQKQLSTEVLRNLSWFNDSLDDLTAFDAQADASDVTSATWIAAATNGQSVVQCTLVSNADGTTVSPKTASYLAITEPPPGPNYAIEADIWYNSDGGLAANIGAGIMVRFADVNTGYMARVEGDPGFVLSQIEGGAGTEAETAFAAVAVPVAAIDTWDATHNQRLRLEVRGSGNLTFLINGRVVRQYQDAAAPYTTTGKAAIFATANGEATKTVVVQFSNIKCFRLDA